MMLDTCALLWLVGGSNKLSRSILKKINESAVVYVSAISGFEIAIKVAKGKLTLPNPPTEWFQKAVDHHGLTVLPLAWDVCIAAAELPAIHDDPCDRFIIATARLNDLAVVTGDGRFAEYGLTVLD